MKERLYLDTMAVIYSVEQVPEYAALVDNRLSDPDITLIISDLTRMECRIKPIRDGDVELLQDYDYFFQVAVAEYIVLTRDVLDCAAVIRARYKFKTPDAIHFAAAVCAKCGKLLTNDHRLDQFRDIEIEILQASHHNYTTLKVKVINESIKALQGHPHSPAS